MMRFIFKLSQQKKVAVKIILSNSLIEIYDVADFGLFEIIKFLDSVISWNRPCPDNNSSQA